MNQNKQIFLAFVIPLLLAIGFLFLRVFSFYDLSIFYKSPEAAFAIRDGYGAPIEMEFLGLLIWALFILSFILPSFVLMRTYQSRRNQLKTKSITE